MVTRRAGNSPRTPRRRKVWVTDSITSLLTSGTTPKKFDLLDVGATALGLNNLYGVTVMRTRGFVKLQHGSTNASVANVERLDLGLAWLPPTIAALADGDAGIPTPNEPGLREVRWLQQGYVEGLEPTTAVQGQGADAVPPEANTWVFDTAQMAKQSVPGAQYSLVLDVGTSGSFESNVFQTTHVIHTLLALP